MIEVPTEISQYGATYEREDISWDSTTLQYQVNQLWASQGKPKDDNNWAYVTVAGQQRYLVALAPIFGEAGDYVDIYVKNGQVYPCLMGDTKGDDDMFIWTDGQHWGHRSGNQCNILEVILKDYSYAPNAFLATLCPIEKIQNGGSYFTHPDGPVGLRGIYSVGGVSSRDQEESTLKGMIGSAVRDIWSTTVNFLDSFFTGRNDITSLYQFKEGGRSDGKSGSLGVNGQGNGDVLAACEIVTKMMIERGCEYPRSPNGSGGYYTDYGKLDYVSGVEEQVYKAHYVCCATYVSCVLYYAGVVSADIINRHAMHSAHAEGIPAIMEEAGWKKVDPSEAQPGDVIDKLDRHAAIYAGDGKIWDEATAVFRTSGKGPIGEPYTYDISSCLVYRMP